jgi:hypothetical protein
MFEQFVQLFEGRPGWRLEPRTSPGSRPLWCFVNNGRIEYSVTVQEGLIGLYAMESDREMLFTDVDELTRWLRAHRAEALQEPRTPAEAKKRRRRFFEWR